ncbi:MAG: endolytic transglycosylase MltG [Minisyncoccia bacterium]
MRKISKNFIILLFFFTFLFFGVLFVNAQNTQQTTALPVVLPTIPPTTPVLVPDRFIVPLNMTFDQIVQNLLEQNYIKNKDDFTLVFSKTKGGIVPGAYKINTTMTINNISKILHTKPYMKWVVIPPGLRKEEIAELLATNLGWTKLQKNNWINIYTKMKYDYVEGVYFPDTYLIPVSETPQAVSKRLISKFNEKFTPYLPQFQTQNIQWTKGLTIASIVQREASSDADMPLIAGILLNRLNQKIPLSVDATLQYVRGNKGKGWWSSISIADKKTDSPYNTYRHAGLPPHPISNPGIPAIEAVLNPTKTDCLYYLHDREHITHCAVTYDEHKANVEKYLKKPLNNNI